MRCLLNLDQLKGTEACGYVEAEIKPAAGNAATFERTGAEARSYVEISDWMNTLV